MTRCFRIAARQNGIEQTILRTLAKRRLLPSPGRVPPTRAGALSSSLPEDPGALQRHGYPGALWYHSCGVGARWTCRRYRGLIDAATGCVRWGSRPLHLLPYRIAALEAVGVKLDSHRTRVEVIQKEFDFYPVVVVRVALDSHVFEA